MVHQPGLKREEQVFLNRTGNDYQRDQLPNPEQIRSDIMRLIGMVVKFDDQIATLLKRRV